MQIEELNPPYPIPVPNPSYLPPTSIADGSTHGFSPLDTNIPIHPTFSKDGTYVEVSLQKFYFKISTY